MCVPNAASPMTTKVRSNANGHVPEKFRGRQIYPKYYSRTQLNVGKIAELDSSKVLLNRIDCSISKSLNTPSLVQEPCGSTSDAKQSGLQSRISDSVRFDAAM